MGSSLVLNCSHNGINCIQKTGAERSYDKIWFTAKQIEEALCVNKRTLNRHIEMLETTGDLSSGTNMTQTNLPDSRGSLHETTIYNLDAFNKICMTFIDNEVCQQVRQKFSDILSEVETKGSYGVNQLSTKQQNILKLFDNKTSDADKAIALKEIVDEETSVANKRAFTSMGRLGGVTTALNAAREALNTANETIKSITSEYDALRESIGQSEDWQSSAQLITNYPEIFGNFKSTSALTRYLKKRNVSHRPSDRPDKTGYLFTIFNVEEAMNVA